LFGKAPAGWRDRFEALREELLHTTPELAVPFGREYGVGQFVEAVSHNPAARTLKKAERVYDVLAEIAPGQSRPTINISLSDLKKFIQQNDYSTLWEVGTPRGGFATIESAMRQKAELAMGTFGLNPIYGALSSSAYGAREYGDAIIEVKPEVVMARAVLLAGDSWRLVNTGNPVYVGVEKVRNIQYHPAWLPDARAAAAMLWVTSGCARQNPEAAAECLLAGVGSRFKTGKGERSYTEFHLIGGLTLDDVARFRVTSESKAVEIVKLLDRLGVNIPIFLVGANKPLKMEFEGGIRRGGRVVFVTGAAATVTNVRPLEPQFREFHRGATAFLEVKGMKGASPSIGGWSMQADTMNVKDIDVACTLPPKVRYKVPALSMQMVKNRETMRASADHYEKQFVDRWLAGEHPFNTAANTAAHIEELATHFPDGYYMKFAVDRARGAAWEPPPTRSGYGVTYYDVPRLLGRAYGWQVAAEKLGVIDSEPMAGAPLGTPPFTC
jgi:hypothetical protein